jgi:hypothetical protein
MHRHLRFLSPACVLALPLLGCSGNGQDDVPKPDVEADSGTDSAPDASHETGSDAPHETDADAADDAGFRANPVLADYAAALRESEPRADGLLHVDASALVDRLVELNANTYAFLIFGETDWDDLGEYLPLAEEAGLATWVYLVPPSELPANYPPHQDDYVAWGDAIGRIAADHPSVTAWAMDDWFKNLATFTPEYTCQMVEASRSHAPDLRFYAVDYYPWVLSDLASPDYVGCIDGVIFPYTNLDANDDLPRQIDQIATMREPSNWIQFAFPAQTTSEPGEYARYAATCEVTDGVKVRFEYLDDRGYGGPMGSHLARFLVDGEVQWSRDTGSVVQPTPIELDLSFLSPGTQADLAFEMYESGGVADSYHVMMSFRNIRIDGCEIGFDEWTYEESAPAFAGRTLEMPGYEDMDLTVMIYAAPTSWHKAPPSAATIREGLELGLDAWEANQANGVISYCLDKSPGSADFSAVQSLYGGFEAE